ncbi:hypothetical protein OG205_16510 [Lentzea sp. NBC_00516]|uniref:hypothetical protein n=1 Tax=Lentzea sp. NBC_00516 TaxID=2903582 RepID=UPI002E80D8FE|nr:hypothetical protein [Lentzea sp. NBC_00516]WUD28537.1 hypothetical protein OG205_16510 [Lentzea sp. NBC_00516]
MLPQWRKTMIATLVAGAVLGLPGMAHASSPSVQVKVCNGSRSGNFKIHGLNQHDAKVSSPLYSIGAVQCRLVENWWWKTGQTLSITVRTTTLHVSWHDINSNERNGSTVRLDLN